MNTEKNIIWLSPKEAADVLRVSLATLYRFIDQEYGALPAHKIGKGTIRISQKELHDWVADHHRGAVIATSHRWTEEEKGLPGYE